MITRGWEKATFLRGNVDVKKVFNGIKRWIFVTMQGLRNLQELVVYEYLSFCSIAPFVVLPWTKKTAT